LGQCCMAQQYDIEDVIVRYFVNRWHELAPGIQLGCDGNIQ
jgi:hypothetical protein